MPAERQTAARFQHRQQHRQPTGIPAHHGPAWRRARWHPHHQRLDFAQHRSRAFQRREHHRPGHARPFGPAGQEQARRIGDFFQPICAHGKDANLVRPAKAVLHSAQDAILVAALAFKIEHGINHVLEDARAGQLPVLGHMADQYQRAARQFGIADQFLRRCPHLRNRTRRAFQRVAVHRLDRIDHQQPRWCLQAGQRCQNVPHIGFGRQRHIGFGQPQPPRP